MHDIRIIRENPLKFDATLIRRGMQPQAEQILKIDSDRRAKINTAEETRAEQNRLAKEIGVLKTSGKESEAEKLRELVSLKKDQASKLTSEAKEEDKKLNTILMSLPQMLFDSVPDGFSDLENIEIKRWGTPRDFSFKPKEHYQLQASKYGMDFEVAARLSGSRFVVLKGGVAQLNRALGQFMLDQHVTINGLIETWTPVIVNEDMMYGTGQLPKFGEDSYQTAGGQWLIPTSEVTLTNLVNGLTVEENSLPLRYCALSQCFRSEAGSAGRDTAGMLRQHQFEKVEMVSITHPQKSQAEHDRMTKCAEKILEALELPYRTMVLCAGDVGFTANKTHDIEVWLPGQNKYREISSISVCEDFQARRMNARYKPADGGKPEFVHTLNGSGLAVGRSLIAILENYQQVDGSVSIPKVLRKYLRNKTTLTKDGNLI